MNTASLETASLWIGTAIIWLFGSAIAFALLFLVIWLAYKCIELFYSACICVHWIIAYKFWSWRIEGDAKRALQIAIDAEQRWKKERELSWYLRWRRGSLCHDDTEE